jgi:ABC-type transporter Mla subunit MlaD
MTLINSAGTKPEEVKNLLERVKEMDNNKEKYIKEATREIQDDLETEQAKLKQYLVTLSAADRLKEPLSGFRKIIGMFQENDPIDALKTKITRAGNVVIKLHYQAKGIELFASRQEDGIEGGISAYLTDNPKVKLTLDADGLDFDGLPTVDAEAVRRMGEFEDKFNAKIDELQEIVNQLNYMIEGKGEEE